LARRTPKVITTRERLLEAAGDTFVARGFAATGVDHIVERAGTTRGAFYYYFASKGDVATDLQRELWGAVAERVQGLWNPDIDMITKFRQAIAAYFGALADLGTQADFLRQSLVDPVLQVTGSDAWDWGVSLISGLLVEGMDLGEIAPCDPDASARLLTEVFELATFQSLSGEDLTDTVAVIEALIDCLVPE
jgi:TetR/AcrR family transcriptional regulator, transcriptional repressor for nem operon